MGSVTPRNKLSVLVVEDEPLMRLGALEMIEAAGFQAIATANAQDAISILERRNDIRAVFTDVQLPGSMNGISLVRVVRDRWPSVALIVTSGQEVDIADIPSGGRFLPKPYGPSEVETALREMMT